MDDEQRIALIGDALVDEYHYRETFDAHDELEIGRLRSLGRRAGRRRKIKVVTTVTEPNDTGDVEVTIHNFQRPDPDDDLANRRLQQRMRDAINALPLPPS